MVKQHEKDRNIINICRSDSGFADESSSIIFGKQNNSETRHFHNTENKNSNAMSKTDSGLGSAPVMPECADKENSTIDSSDNCAIDSSQDQSNVSPPDMVRGEFDERGGFLTHPEHDVFLFVPPGAVITQSMEITMTIIQPQDTPTEKHVMPVIEMGPEGTHFKQPVYLCYQRQNDSSKAKVCVDIKQTNDNWKHADEQDASYFVDEKEITVGLWHFTRIRASNQLDSVSDNEEQDGCSEEQGCGGATAACEPSVRQEPVEADDLPSFNPGALNTQTAHVIVYERSINSSMRHLTCYVMKDLNIMVKLSYLKGIQATGLPQPMSLSQGDGDVSVQLMSAEDIVEDSKIRITNVYRHGYSVAEFIIATQPTNVYKLRVQQGCQDNSVDILVPVAATTTPEKTCLPLLLRYKLLTHLDDPQKRKEFTQFLKEQLATKDEEIDTFERLQRYQQAERQSNCKHLVDIFEMKVRSQHQASEDGLKKLMAHFQANPDSIMQVIQNLLYPETHTEIRQPEDGAQAEASAPQQQATVVQMRTHEQPRHTIDRTAKDWTAYLSDQYQSHDSNRTAKDSAYVSCDVDDLVLGVQKMGNYE